MFSKGKGKSSGGSSSWTPVMKPQFSKKSSGVTASQTGAKAFDASQRVWIGGLTKEVTVADLQELLNTVGRCELVQIHRQQTAVACFQTSDEAQLAIATLNGSAAGDIVLQFDSWVPEPKAKGYGGASGGPAKDHLVARLKAFQRSSNDQQQAWHYFCDEHLGGRRDPAKADAGFLQIFCDTIGVPEIESQQNWKGGGSTGDVAKDRLVARIKDFQRSDNTHQLAWQSFCDENLEGKRDPAKADADRLQFFCDVWQVP